VRLHVVAPAGTESGSRPIRFVLDDLDSDDSAESASAFLAGGQR
jgi:hypothetical protein